MKIKYCPEEAWDYEYIVVNNDDDMIYCGCYADGDEAERCAKALPNGMVIHNMKIQGHKEPPKQKQYTFCGVWSWCCYATSTEEAIKKYEDEAYPEMLDIETYDSLDESEIETE